MSRLTRMEIIATRSRILSTTSYWLGSDSLDDQWPWTAAGTVCLCFCTRQGGCHSIIRPPFIGTGMAWVACAMHNSFQLLRETAVVSTISRGVHEQPRSKATIPTVLPLTEKQSPAHACMLKGQSQFEATPT